MALKPKTSVPTPTLPPINENFEAFIATQRPEVNEKLDNYIAQNSRKMEYAEYLVKRHPDRAVRTIMLDKMRAYEREMKTVERLAPRADEWLKQQPATLKVSILERLKKINPFYHEAAKLRMIKSAKINADFAPRPALGTGMSA